MQKQIDLLWPKKFKKISTDALSACGDIRMISFVNVSIVYTRLTFSLSFTETEYKDICDKSYYQLKCIYNFSPESFLYP